MNTSLIEKFIVIKILLLIVMIIGWGINIYQIVSDFTTFADIGAEMVLRIVGIVLLPLGGFMGLFIW